MEKSASVTAHRSLRTKAALLEERLYRNSISKLGIDQCLWSVLPLKWAREPRLSPDFEPCLHSPSMAKWAELLHRDIAEVFLLHATDALLPFHLFWFLLWFIYLQDCVCQYRAFREEFQPLWDGETFTADKTPKYKQAPISKLASNQPLPQSSVLSPERPSKTSEWFTAGTAAEDFWDEPGLGAAVA